MSEEEIIDKLTKISNNFSEAFNYNVDEKRELIQGLLDLYDEEKEKNKELYEIKYIASRFINRSMKQFSIGEFKYKVNKFIECEDKIKEKIEKIIIQVENDSSVHMESDEYDYADDCKEYCIDKLKELLEEME